MKNTLKLYKEVIVAGKTERISFPGSGQDWAYISDYKYSATRMSSAPSISATLKWPICLDKEWSTDVFVEYNGERYFVKNTPSSSYDNTSCLYSHTLELVSERAILDSVYFLDINTEVSGDGENPQGDSLSDNSDFSFSGDISELADRLNKSMVRSGIGGVTGYSVVVDDGITSKTKLFSVSNQYISDTLKAAYELYEVPYYFVGKTIHFGNQQSIIEEPFEYGSDKSLLSISKSNSNSKVITRITGAGSDRNIPYYYPNPTPKGKIYLDTNATGRYAISDMNKFADKIELDEKIKYSYGMVSTISAIGLRNEDGDFVLLPYDGMLIPANTTLYEATISIVFTVSNNGLVLFDISANNSNYPLLKLWISTWCNNAEVVSGDNVRPAIITTNGVDCGELSSGSYILLLHSAFHNNTNNDCRITINATSNKNGRWTYSRNSKIVNIEQCGVSVVSGEPQNGDYIIQRQEWRIDVKNNLMPSEYRRTLGKNRWYNATNAADRGDWYGDVIFDTQHNDKHPFEYIHAKDDIYPTINGVENARGQRIDTVIDIAFDSDDNNDIYPEGHEKEGQYIHPYFFVKLKRTDGPHGFNLFDHAIESEPMKISFTTGHVASCEFEIGVDEDTQKNPVEVDENGDLVRDEDGNVVIGRYIDSQQDTQNNEVWLALKKEDATMGVLMPDSTKGFVPIGDLLPTGDLRDGGGDTFVILGIQLPEAYIISAEDKLEKALLEYLKENNKEKFSFSIKFSSIYLAENPEISKTINENCKLSIVYNDEIFSMYATSYSVTVKDGVALPEVVVNIDNELKVVKPKVKDISSVIDSTEIKIKDVKKSIRYANASIKTLSTNSNDITNQVNTLIGDDAWMSAREIAEDVVAKNGGGGGGGTGSTITITSSNSKYIGVTKSSSGTFIITPKVLSIDDHGTSQDESENFGLATTEDVKDKIGLVKDWVEAEFESYLPVPFSTPSDAEIVVYDTKNGTIKGSSYKISATTQDLYYDVQDRIPTCAQVTEFIDDVIGNINTLLETIIAG